jgi:hypothetical protein
VIKQGTEREKAKPKEKKEVKGGRKKNKNIRKERCKKKIGLTEL